MKELLNPPIEPIKCSVKHIKSGKHCDRAVIYSDEDINLCRNCYRRFVYHNSEKS